jgi:hypothetical protein
LPCNHGCSGGNKHEEERADEFGDESSPFLVRIGEVVDYLQDPIVDYLRDSILVKA